MGEIPSRSSVLPNGCKLQNASNRRPSGGRDDGFSLLELLVVVGIAGTLIGTSILIANQVLPTIRADSAMQLVQAQLLQTRQNAADQRRNFTVTFNPSTGEVKVVRNEIGTPPTTLIADYFLPYNASFQLLPGVPDTPDAFGNLQAVTFGGNTVNFLSDGTVTDGTNTVNNGTVFIAIGTNPLTARAVAVTAATGRIRAYRWNGTSWN